MSKSAPTKNLGVISKQMYDLLDGLDSAERTKVVNSVLQLYGDDMPTAADGTASSQGVINTPPSSRSATQQQFFAAKSPKNKGEMLAVAARYRELYGGGDVHQQTDFSAFFTEARQNFDRKHFLRDMKNAQHQAGLFNTGMGKGQYQLSYYGQQFVDALPDRDVVAKLKRPNRRTAGKRKQAKKATK